MKAKELKNPERSRGFEIGLGIVSFIVAVPFTALLAFAMAGAIKEAPTIGGFIASLLLALACYVLLRTAYATLLRPYSKSLFNPYVAFALCVILSLGSLIGAFAYAFAVWSGEPNTAVPRPHNAGGLSLFTAPFIFGGAALHFLRQARLTTRSRPTPSARP